MKGQFQRTVNATKKAMFGALREMQGPPELDDDQLIERYVNEHRGNPDAIIAFAQEMAPGNNPISEGVRYERQMEHLLRSKGYE